jgi:hypothetical protein
MLVCVPALNHGKTSEQEWQEELKEKPEKLNWQGWTPEQGASVHAHAKSADFIT